MPDGLKRLVAERSIWIVVFDALSSTAILLAVHYLSPGDADLVKILVGIWQAPIIALLAKNGIENVATTNAAAATEIAKTNATVKQ